MEHASSLFSAETLIICDRWAKGRFRPIRRPASRRPGSRLPWSAINGLNVREHPRAKEETRRRGWCPIPLRGLCLPAGSLIAPVWARALGNVSDGDTPNIPMAHPLCFAVDTPPSRWRQGPRSRASANREIDAGFLKLAGWIHGWRGHPWAGHSPSTLRPRAGNRWCRRSFARHSRRGRKRLV